jgi:hypothetical protein
MKQIESGKCEYIRADLEPRQAKWSDSEGFEWVHEPAWEGCEAGITPVDPDEMVDPELLWAHFNSLPLDGCTRPTEYVGRRGQTQWQLCSLHFGERNAVRRD